MLKPNYIRSKDGKTGRKEATAIIQSRGDGF